MKCLSLWQPWASLVVAGHKRVETRGWPIRHRGPLLIHAAKTWNADLAFTAGGVFFRPALEAAGVRFDATEAACKRGWNLPFGAVVGRVDVVGCYRTDEVAVLAESKHDPVPWRLANGTLGISDAEWAFGDYSAGRYAFLCENPVRFDRPIPWPGKQGLFDVPADILPGFPPPAPDLGGEG